MSRAPNRGRCCPSSISASWAVTPSWPSGPPASSRAGRRRQTPFRPRRRNSQAATRNSPCSPQSTPASAGSPPSPAQRAPAKTRPRAVDVLPAGAAITLFRRIAGEDRVRDADQVAVAVGLCGRLPLAIQLTASQIAQDGGLSLDGLIEELSQSPVWLGGSGTASPEVAASPEVTAAFDLSYRALEPDHQRFFRRPGVSPCACLSPPAAAALGGCTLAEAEKALAALLDCHLLARAGDGQFRFHDLIRGYAAVRAAHDDGEAEQRQTVGRLLDYYLHTADRADRVLHPFRRRTPVQVTQIPAASPALGTKEDAAGWLESEWRNILQAARHAGRREWKQKCADLIHVLADFLEIKAYWDEAIAAHALALHACPDLADTARNAQATPP